MPDVGRVLRGINVPGQSVESFLDLTPILTENFEFGVEYSGEFFSSQLSWYTSDSDFGQRLQRGADGIYSVRREQTEVNGFEFRAAWQTTASDTLELRYAQADGRYDSNADGSVDSDLDGSNISPDRANFSWEHTWTTTLSTRLQVNHMLDRAFTNRTGTTVNEFDGYTTTDFSAQLQAFGGNFNLAIQNLTGTDYYTYYSQVNPNDIRNFKGVGRSFSLAWQRSF